MVVYYIKVYLLHIKRKNEKLKKSLFDKVNINEENRGET